MIASEWVGRGGEPVAPWLGRPGCRATGSALARESVELATRLGSPMMLGLAQHVLGLMTWGQGEVRTATAW